MGLMSTKASTANANPHLKGNRFTRLMQQYWRCRYLVMLLIPSVVVLIIFKYFPMYGIVMAFQNFRLARGFFRSPWIGFENFEKVFSSAFFPIVLKNTLVIILFVFKVVEPFIEHIL